MVSLESNFADELSFTKPELISTDGKYGIRFLNPNIPLESQILSDIDRSPRAIEFMGDYQPSSGEDLDFYTRAGDNRIILGVTDKIEGKGLYGWVQIYQDENTRIDQINEEVPIPEGSMVLEVSYAKLFANLPDKLVGKFPQAWEDMWERDEKEYSLERANLEGDPYFIKERAAQQEEGAGVAVSGLNQAMQFLRKQENIISDEMQGKPRQIFITAYTDPKNVASERVLEKNGFIKLTNQIDYDGEKNNAWIREI